MSNTGSEPSASWDDRVAFDAAGVAYRPGELVVAGERARQLTIGRLASDEGEPVFDEQGLVASPQFYRFRGVFDPVAAALDLRDNGAMAQPNHVMFAHCAGGCSCPCLPHPAMRWAAGVTGSPMFASPMFASPMFASPMFASPMFASPMFASPMFASPAGRRRNSARPCAPPRPAWAASKGTTGPRVAILDTGLAARRLRPAALGSLSTSDAHWERPDEDGDRALDPAAGHGTFIAGIIERLAPGCDFTIERVLSTDGDGDEVAIARRIDALAGQVDLFNLSFGGYSSDQMRVLGAAVRRAQAAGAVVVASAGNDATCRPSYPSALHGVIGVGAVGPNGPAPFSNYGPWVRACAPGVDVVSTFFSRFEGPAQAPPGGTDPDDFDEWAVWSGTSFAAPVVVAALARQMQSGATAAEAVARVIDAPALLRIPDLGTVVNVQ